MMERVNFDNKQFDVCKNFLTVCNKGKGQNIRIRINEKNIEKYLTKDGKFFGDFSNVSDFNRFYIKSNYMKIVENSIKKTMLGLETHYGWGYGDWSGTNRTDEILEWEKRLQITKRHFEFLHYIDLDPNAFNYMISYSMNSNGTFSLIFNSIGTEKCEDIKKLAKFLEFIGYKNRDFVCYPTSSIHFDDLNIDHIEENKTIWEFI